MRLPSVPVSPFSPVQIGPLTLKNRFIKSATNEGMAKGGIVSEGLAKFHAEIARGGAAMTVVAYCAVSADGRTFEDQAVLNAAARADFAALVDRVHAEGAAVCAQITHAGCFSFLSRKAAQRSRPFSASGGFNKFGAPAGRLFRSAMTRADMDTVVTEFMEAAILARTCGFDAVELHMGHGYLLSQFLSPLYNRRTDAYGGRLENRLSFPLEVLTRVLDAVGDDLAVTVKYSMTDGHPEGAELEDGIAIACALEAAGAHMVVLSNGLNAESVSSMFGSNLPDSVLRRPRNRIERKVMDWMKISGFDPVEFQELYLLDKALQVRTATGLPLCYLGGVQSLAAAEAVLAAGFETVALGRALLHQPDLIRQFQSGAVTRSGCTACNECVGKLQAPSGVYCVLREPPEAAFNLVGASHRLVRDN